MQMAASFKERLLSSRNHITMETWRHISLEIVWKRRNTPTLMYHGTYDRLNFRIFRSDWNDTECYVHRQR